MTALTATSTSPSPVRRPWLRIALCGLVLLGLGLVLGHAAIETAVDHADCAVCHGLHHMLAVAAVSAGAALGAVPLRRVRSRVAPCGRVALPFHGRAPPFHALA